MDIIVTTPKRQMANAAQEAADIIAAGGGEYFRRFSSGWQPMVFTGDRVYYVEDGYVRGFAIVSRLELKTNSQLCDTTGRRWEPGFYVFMDATTWQWLDPFMMTGFQGFRYADQDFRRCEIDIVGGWRDPRPRLPSSSAPSASLC